MAETGKKMGDYTPLESNKKEYFLGDGEGSVVAVGKTEAAGEKTNRLVKLSEISGDKLPSGGTEGQVLTKTASGEAWAEPVTELPSGGNEGDVLTQTANGPAWSAPSGGGGAPYTRTTASFSEPSLEGNYYKQSITIQNNTYTVGSGIIPEPEGEGYRTKRLDVRLTADFPMAILKLENLNLELNEIHVFNGNTELQQLYPIAIKLDEPNYHFYGNEYASYAHSNFGQASIVEIHILGDTYTILSSVGATDGLS